MKGYFFSRMIVIVQLAIGIICLLPVANNCVWANEVDSGIRITAQPEQNSYTIGEEIFYEIVIQWNNPALNIEYRIPKPQLENLGFVEAIQSSSNSEQGSKRLFERRITYRLKSLQIGPAKILPFTFEYWYPNGSHIFKEPLPEVILQINVAPLLTRINWFILGLLGLCAIACFGFYRYLRFKAMNDIEEVEISFEESATIELVKIKDFAENDAYVDCLKRSSQIFREYVQKKYELASGKNGVMEIYSQIERRRDILPEERKKITQILQILSESQFGGTTPADDEVTRLYAQICDFIQGKMIV